MSRRQLRALSSRLAAMEARLEPGVAVDTVLRSLPRFLEEGCRSLGFGGRMVLVHPSWASRVPGLLLGVRSHVRYARAGFGGLRAEDAPHLAALERFLRNLQAQLPPPRGEGGLVLVPDVSPAGIGFTPERLRGLLQRQPPRERLVLQGETLMRFAFTLEKAREPEPDRPAGVHLPAPYPVPQLLVMLSMLAQQAAQWQRAPHKHDLPTLQQAIEIAVRYQAALTPRDDRSAGPAGAVG